MPEPTQKQSSPQAPRVQWEQTHYEELMASHSVRRQRRDEKTLRKVFAAAVDCPILAEALEWATAHGIKFYVDRTGKDMGGYYTNGTGVVALLPKLSADKVGTIVHEIRHAWQDYHGFLPAGYEKSFADYAMNDALIEADAAAHGLVAKEQMDLHKPLKRLWRKLFAPRKLTVDVAATLEDGFLAWFATPATTRYYGRLYSETHGELLDVYTGKGSKGRAEFNPDLTSLQCDGIDTGNLQDVRRLGKSFSGGSNYLAHLHPDVLPKDILRPSLVYNFWGAARRKDRKLTAAIRKEELREKLEEPRPRHPWP